MGMINPNSIVLDQHIALDKELETARAAVCRVIEKLNCDMSSGNDRTIKRLFRVINILACVRGNLMNQMSDSLGGKDLSGIFKLRDKWRSD